MKNVVRPDSDAPLTSVHFHEASVRRHIEAGSEFDWYGKRAIFGWSVGSVRALAEPIPVGTTSLTGFGARSFSDVVSVNEVPNIIHAAATSFLGFLGVSRECVGMFREVTGPTRI